MCTPFHSALSIKQLGAADALAAAYGISPATAAVLAAAGPDALATALRIFRAATDRGAAVLTGPATLTTTGTVSAATTPTSTTVRSGGGASPYGGAGAVGAGSVPRPSLATPTVPSTACLRRLDPSSPPPSSVGCLRVPPLSPPPTAPSLRPWRAPRPQQPPPRSTCMWLPLT
jgi:hypothetical protein